MYGFNSALLTAGGNYLLRSRRAAFLHSSRATISRNRKFLPPKLSEDVVRLTCKSRAKGGVCDVYLVGTVYQSKESRQQVKDVINFLKPQVVFLELCLQSYDKLERAGNKVSRLFEPFFFNSFKHSGFLVAIEEANKCGAKIIPGDRSIDITLSRVWIKMALWQKIKSGVDKLTLVIQKLMGNSPTIEETLLDERDQYMAATLLKFARKHNSVVAVVGKAHLPGMQKYWKQPIDVKKLLVDPLE